MTHRHPQKRDAIERLVDAIERAVDCYCTQHAIGPTLHVSGVRGRRVSVATKPVPPLTMSDVQSVQLSLAPVLPDGSPDPGPFTWVSSDPAIGTLVGDAVDADGNHAPDATNTSPTGTVVWLLTPAGTGTVTVTVTSASPNVDGNSIAVTLVEGRSGDVNLSAGTPVADQ